jgi:hypothetical protein
MAEAGTNSRRRGSGGEHLGMHAGLLPQAVGRPLDGVGHQLNEDLAVVARDIKATVATA